eukprot:10918-Heterococcus_DN1.PRE.2
MAYLDKIIDCVGLYSAVTAAAYSAVTAAAQRTCAALCYAIQRWHSSVACSDRTAVTELQELRRSIVFVQLLLLLLQALATVATQGNKSGWAAAVEGALRGDKPPEGSVAAQQSQASSRRGTAANTAASATQR